MTIPVTANIGGSYTSPKVKTDLTSGVSNLTNQLIEIQKQKLLNQGKKEVTNLINNVIGGNQTKTDSLKKEQSNAVESVLNNIIKPNKTSKDSTKNDHTTKAVKNVLGGLFGKKKTDTITK